MCSSIFLHSRRDDAPKITREMRRRSPENPRTCAEVSDAIGIDCNLLRHWLGVSSSRSCVSREDIREALEWYGTRRCRVMSSPLLASRDHDSANTLTWTGCDRQIGRGTYVTSVRHEF